jgi:hypothetical protein
MFARAVAMVGDAAAIASLALVTPTLRRVIVAWLAPLEHVVRKLLLAEAAALIQAERAAAKRGVRLVHVPLRGLARHAPSGSARPPAAHNALRKRETRPEAACSNLDPSHPETWSAPFAFALPRDPYRVANAHAPRIRALWGEHIAPSAPAQTARSVRREHTGSRLARRFEALRRVLEDPRPHAERLARTLAREVERNPQAAQRYLLAPCRTGDYDRADPRLGVDATACAFDAPLAFADSG